MVHISQSAPRRATRRRAPLWSRAAVPIPVLIVAAVLLLAVALRLASYGGDVTGFVKFGSSFTAYTHPPRGAVVGTGTSTEGYDGQFYYVMARDPLLLHESTVDSLLRAPQNDPRGVFASRTQAFRMLRVGYPATVALVAAVTGLSTAWSMLAVNVLVVLVLTAGFAAYARRRGWSVLWAAALGLLPGLLLATRRDLGDPLAAAAALGGLLAWIEGRRRLGVALLILAVLTREVMMAAVVALALEAGVRAWRQRGIPDAARRIARETWPAIVLPAAAFLGWHLYVDLRTGGSVGGAGLTAPFDSFVDELQSLAGLPAAMAAWQGAYMVVMIAATVAAFASLRRGLTVMSAAAAMFGLTVLVAPFNDAWGDARDSLPLLVLLLVLGLERRDRTVLGICLAAAAMTALIPFGIPGPF
jgi:hypothetical protein